LAEAPAGTPGAVDAGRGMAPPRRPGFLLPGAALAASVAALAMFMARQAPEPAMPAAPAMEIASAAETVPAAPRPAQPVAPAAPAAPDAALQAAGGVIAVAEVPRRAAERRSRAQQQRAAASRAQRSAATEPVLVAAAGSASAPATAPDAVVERAANPFALEAAAEAITARPWPRARGGWGVRPTRAPWRRGGKRPRPGRGRAPCCRAAATPSPWVTAGWPRSPPIRTRSGRARWRCRSRPRTPSPAPLPPTPR